MKGKYKYLLRMQLYNLFGINRLIHSRDKQEKQRSAIVGALGLTAIAILVVYTTKFSNSMALAGLSEALPTLMVVVCSLATLTLTFVKSTGVLIGLKDYDMVMSMPVSTISIVTSRITMLYLINLIIGFIAMLPSSIIYVVYEHPPVFSYLFLVGVLFLTPIIPMIISLSLGVLIVAVSSHSRHKNVFSLVLSTAAILMIVLASAKTQSMDEAQITNLGVAMAEAVNKFYPPAILFTNALLHNDLAGFVIFATVSLLLGIAFITIVSHYYKRLNTAVFSHYAKKEYKMGTLTSTTAASLSLEGKNRWIMCSVPTQARTVYNSKIAVNLTVILPVLYISAIFIRIAITCSLMQTVLLFIIPTVYTFFISVLGVYLNIKFPKYDWTSE